MDTWLLGTIEQDNTKHCIIETVKYLQVDKVMYASVQSFVIKLSRTHIALCRVVRFPGSACQVDLTCHLPMG